MLIETAKAKPWNDLSSKLTRANDRYFAADSSSYSRLLLASTNPIQHLADRKSDGRPLLDEEQSRNIYVIVKYPDALTIDMTIEARKLATEMYFAALEKEQALGPIEWIFGTTLGGWGMRQEGLRIIKRGASIIRNDMIKRAFGLGEYSSVEARFVGTGAASIYFTAAQFKPRYVDLVMDQRDQ